MPVPEPVIVVLLLLAATLVCGARSFGRWMELFVLDVRDGQVVFVRGRAPQSLLTEIADVMSRPPVRSARIVVRRDQGRARVVADGEIDPGQVQQLRNVVACYPMQKILAGNRRR